MKPAVATLLKGLFFLNSFMMCKFGAAQDVNIQAGMSFNAGPKTSLVASRNIGPESKTRQNMSQVNDTAFLEEQNTKGFQLKDRSLGFINLQDENGIKSDSVTFYTFENEVNGYKVKKGMALAHAHDGQYDKFEQDNLLYQQVTITDPEGKQVHFVSNSKTGDYFLTCVTDEKGRQAFITLQPEEIEGKMDEVLSTNPGAAFGFIKQAIKENKKAPFFVSTPWYAGQDKGDGTFELIHITDKGFAHNKAYTPTN